MILSQADTDLVACAATPSIVCCADDFGMAGGIDAGILDLAEAGRLSAVSCMSGGAVFRQQAAGLASLSVDRGLHLNLTERLPGNRFFQPLPRLIANSWARRLAEECVSDEIERQLDAFEAVIGAAPDYVDGHQHVHQFPVIRDCLLAILQRRYPAQRPWLRSTLPATFRASLDWRSRLKAGLIACLGGHTLRAAAVRYGLPTNGHLLGVYDFTGGESRYAALLGGWLAAAEGGDLLMCHPAAFADTDDPLAQQRLAEYRVLSGPRLTELLAARGMTIGRLTSSASTRPE